MVNEVLNKMTPLETWIDDFVHSKNAKFAGKSTAERISMAKGAYYAKQKRESVEEAAAVSQNSTAMQDMNEDHLVHVNDGSKYDEQPHEKDVEHVMAGVKLHGGEHAGASDKGVFFKFKSPEHASSFISHVNKCPHRSCDAHMSEAVEYKGIGTDVVDKKKKLNPQPNFTTDKKTVKDFKEAKELDKACWKGYKAIGLKNKNGRQVPNCVPEEKELEEAKVYDPFTKKMVPNKPIKVQAGGGATKNGVPVETGPSKYKQSLKKEEVEQIDELDKKTIGSYAKKATKDLKWQQTMRPFDAKRISNREKGIDRAIDKLTKEEVELIDELSKGLVARYANKVAKTTQTNYDKSKDKFQFSSNRQDGMKNAVKRLTKEESEQVDESSLHRQHFQLVADLIRGHESAEKRKELAHHHAELFKKANPRFDHAKFMKAAGVNEEVQIDELSKDTLASYAKKASQDARIKQHVAADFKSKEAHARNPRKKETWGSIAKKYQSKAWKREDGHDKAVDKLAGTKPSRPGDITGKSFTEDVQIDEISKSTLARYIPSAARDVGSHTYAGKEAGEWANHYTRAGDWSAAEKHSKKSYADFKKANKRVAGIDRATKKLATQKEEVELDEAIAKKLPVQHAVDAVHATLGPKSATRFLSHLSPGTEKHTSWDKVNDALVKQGVQTHHIASIAQKTSHMNEAYTDKEYQSAMNAYLKKGGKVETLPARKPRPSEKTFINRTGSIWKKGYTKSAVSGFNNKSQTTVDDRNKHIREESVEESRGHKVLGTFFKNREVAQRSYQGNPAKDAEVAQGGGSPADQGIAAAKRDAQELKKKVAESKTPAVHAALPKKTKTTAKEYASASIPGTKRVNRAKDDNNEPGEQIKEDQYTSEYKIKAFVDPITGENKTRKIRPHRINFKSSKMNAAPAQMTEPTKVTEGHDDYSSIAKELIKKHGKNVTAQHVKDFAGERDTHRGLDHAEVMHHVKKLSEDDKVYDEKWKKVKFTDFIKGAK